MKKVKKLRKIIQKAADYYRKAAEFGNSDALVNLGNLYHDGLGFGKDYSKAADYYRKAAELGN